MILATVVGIFLVPALFVAVERLANRGTEKVRLDIAAEGLPAEGQD